MGLLLVFFIYFCFSLSSSPVGRALLSDAPQDHRFDIAGSNNHNSNRIKGDHDQNGKSGIMYSSNFARGTGSAGARGAGASGTTDTAKGNDESNGSGAESVPSTVSGTSNYNHHSNTRHNAASCLKNCIMFPTLIMVVLASLVVHLYV